MSHRVPTLLIVTDTDRASLPAGIATATGDTDTATLATAPSPSGSQVADSVATAAEAVNAEHSELKSASVASSVISSVLSPSASGNHSNNGTNGTGAGVRLVPTGAQVYVGPAIALIGAIGAGLAIFA